MKINPQFLKFVIVGDTGTGKRTLLSPYGVPPRLSPLYLRKLWTIYIDN